MIDVIDDFFEESVHQRLYNFCLRARYRYGECDAYGLPPVGMVSDILPNGHKSPYDLFEESIEREFNICDLPYRMYINLFAPNEQPFWHSDGQTGYTFLYYPNLEWSENDLGETQFLIDGEIKGILPKPNRMLGFDASLLHRATTFRDKHRFTIAIKYS